MLLRAGGLLQQPLISLSPAGLMFLRGLDARWMLAVAALAIALTASEASPDAGFDPSALLGNGALGRPLKQPAVAVAVGLKNIIFPPCPPEVASSVKDQLGIAKFWNLWNITDNQDKTLFPVSKNESKARAAHPCTIFAVPDDSFTKQPNFYASLEENPLAATEFISNHIIGGPVILQTNKTLTSVGGLSITPLQKDGVMFINGIKVTKSETKLPSGSYLYVIAGPLCCTTSDVIPLARTLNGSVVGPISPNLGDVGSFVFDRPSISYLRKAHLLPGNYTVKARQFSIGRGPSSGNGTGLTRYVYRSPASIWGAGQPSSIGVQNDSIYQVLPGLSGTTFLTLLQLADCRPSLKGRDPVTLFMPTDEALASLPPRDIQALIADPERLRQTLLYHIAPGTFTSGDLSTNVSITTVEGKPLRTDTYGNTTLNVEGAKVILSDIIGHNGVIHIIDRFLYPVPNGTLSDLIKKTPNVNQFLELCKKVNLTDFLTGGEPYTVFAPTNDALATFTKSIPSTPEGDKRLREILLNHIVPGIVYTASWSPGQVLPTAGGHTIYLQYQPNESGGFSLLPNGATVAKSDLGATNGVCHIINKVMPIEYAPAEPPQKTFWKDIWQKVLDLFGKPEAPIVPPVEEPPKDTIITTLKKLPNAKELLDAFNITGLLPKLEEAGPFTILVPVNSAFDQLKRPISELIKTNRPIVEKILLNHIIPTKLYCEKLKTLPTVKSLQGTILTISPSTDGCAKVDDTDILYWNITAKNGIIHLIDKIISAKDLIPEELLTTTEMEILTTTELEISTIEEILSTTMGLPSTSTVPSVPEVTSEKEEATTEEGIISSSEGTTITTEEVTLLPDAPTTTSEEISTVVAETSTAVTAITTETTLAPVNVTSAVPEGVSVVTTETAYSPTSGPSGPAYVIPGEETTIGQPREFPGPGTENKTVIYLPVNVSDTMEPRPMVTFNTSTPTATTLVDVLRQLNLTTYPNMLNMTGLDETLPREGPLTIFAPTDAAFNKLDVPTLDKLFEDKEYLRRVLKYHVVPSPITGDDLPRALQAFTLEGAPVFITVYVIHDKPTAFINNATISPTQHIYNGTIVYLIDMVLISPPEVDLYTTISKILKEETTTKSINKVNLDPLLTGPSPITVFVPTEAAWNNIPEGFRKKLETDENALKDFILSHIIRGAVFTPVMIDGSKFITSNGKVLTITRENGLIKVNNSHIINPDIVAINGVIHVIDTVLPLEEPEIGAISTLPATVEIAATTPTALVTEITSEPLSTEIATTEETTEKSTIEPGITEVTSEHVSTLGVEVTTEVPITSVPGVTETTTEEVTGTTPSENVTTVAYPTTTPSILPLIPSLRKQGLTTLAELLESIFAPKILNLYGLFTLFAPTNEAFESLTPEELKNLKADSQALQQMLLYQAINRILPYDNITDNLQIPSIQGNNLTFNVYDNGQVKTVLGSKIVKPDIKVENGLVHVIDHLLYPIPRKTLLEVVDNTYPTFSSAINTTDNRPNLKDKGVTAFIPSEEFWARVPQPMRDTILSNSSLMNDLVRDHVCSGRTFKVGIRDGTSCTSLSGKTLHFTVKDNIYYVNEVPIILFDIISTDGIIHVLNKPLYLDVPGVPDIIGPIPVLPPTRPPPKRPTTAAPSGITGTTLETSTGAIEVTSPTAVTEHATSTEITSEIPYVTEEATSAPSITETTTSGKPEETEGTTLPESTPIHEETVTTAVPEATSVTSETTSQPEHTTVFVTETSETTPHAASPNATIPSIIQQQFHEAGYPIEVTELTPKLPETTLYTAFIPYSVYLSGLPIEFLQDLTKNTTAIGDIFANHICPGAKYSPEFENGFTCVSLGGNVITVTLQNGKYYCNGFPIIRMDVPALDGVVHFINGLLIVPITSTTPVHEPTTITAITTPQYTEISKITTSTVQPTVSSTEEVITSEIQTTTEIEGYTVTMNVTVPAIAQVTEATEYTTVPREPKELNITEATEESTSLPEFTTGITQIPEITTGIPEATTGATEVTRIPEVTSGIPEVTTGIPEVTTGISEVTTGIPEVTRISEVTTGIPELSTGTPEVTTGLPEVTTGISEVTPGIPEVTPGIPEVTPGIPEVTPGIPEVTTGIPEVTGISEVTTGITEVVEYTTVIASTTEIPVVPIETTTLHEIVPSNKTIPETVREEFTNAGYPIDVTDLQQKLPDNKLYTAFIPYSVYVSGLPSPLLQDLINNKTALTDTMLNHICQDATYSTEFNNGFTCTSLGGKPIIVTFVNDQYYCNGFPIIRVDIPAADGVIHLINGILFFAPEVVSPPATETTQAYTTTEPTETTLREEVTTSISEVTLHAETLPTTQYTATREPKELNITEIYPGTTEYPPTVTKAIPSTFETPTVTEYTEVTTAYPAEVTSPYSVTEKKPSTEYPGVSISETTPFEEVTSEVTGYTTPTAVEQTTVKEYPEITTEPYIHHTVSPSELPTASEEITTQFPEITSEGITAEITTTSELPAITSVSPEYTTAITPKVLTNLTIPSVIKEQFEQAGYPIDVEDIHLPDTSLYTACIPYSLFLSTLPSLALQDITRNNTATTNSLLDLICEGATYSYQLKNGYTCTSLGGKPIVFEFRNNQYYCNKFLVVRTDFQTTDGVVHFINGFLFLEPEGTTVSPHEITESPTSVSPTGIISEGTTTEAVTTTPEVTEYTTLKTGTREPKVLNITEPSVTTEYPEVTTEAVPSSGITTETTSTAKYPEITTKYTAEPEVTTKYPEITSEGAPIETTEYTAAPEVTTKYPEITSEGAPIETTEYKAAPEVTTKYPEITSEGVPTETTAYTAAPEVTTEYPAVTVITKYPEVTTEAVPSPRIPTETAPTTKYPEITSEGAPIETTEYKAAPEVTTKYPEITSEGAPIETTEYTAVPEVTTKYPEITSEGVPTETTGFPAVTVITEHPAVTVTREPKVLNISEPSVTTEYPEVTTEAVPSSGITTETTPTAKYPEITSEGAPIETTEYTAAPEVTTEYPAVTIITKHPESTTELTEITVTKTTPIEYTTSSVPEIESNETIPSVFQQQFEKAGHPIDVSDVLPHLPDTSLYTACVPYSIYLLTLPSLFLQEKTSNKTAVTNILLDHICEGAIYSTQMRNGYTCTSLGGKAIIFTFKNNHYYCNSFPIIKVDIPTSDGVIHFINGLLFFEQEGITLPPTELTTEFTEVSIGLTPTIASVVSETTATGEVLLTTTEVPEYTTLKTVTREPKVLNVTEPTTVYEVTTEATTSSEYPEATTSPEYPEATTSSEYPEVTKVTGLTSESPLTTVKATAYPEPTTEQPVIETTQYVTAEEATSTEYSTATSEVPKTTEKISAEYTTSAPNQTIPSVIQQEFENAGYPIDVTEIQQHLPATTLYTACVPYSTYLSTLPKLFIQDLTRNSTAITNVLLNHICEGATYSSQLKNSHTCTSLLGKPIILSFHNNQYFCNNYPVIQVDVPASDGVIYFINGLFFLEPEGITTPAIETTVTYTKTSSPYPSVTPTGITEVPEAATSIGTTETATEAETTPSATEYTTLKTVTRGPKELNITEPTEISPETTEYTKGTSTISTITTLYPEASTEVPAATFETTVATEITSLSPEQTNETIPEIIKDQFEIAGYPIDVTEVEKHLPDTIRYTACIPYNIYLSTLPGQLLHDLTTNNTATTSVLLNHICPGEIYSSQFKNGFTCISLGGKPIFLTTKYGQYYCNNIPIIQFDISTSNGVVHLINGLLFYEPPAVTSPAPEITTTFQPTVPAVTLTEITTEYFEATTKEGVTTATESTPYEYTTQPASTKEPERLNITESSVIYPEITITPIATEYPEISTKEPVTTTYGLLESTTATGLPSLTETIPTEYPEITEKTTRLPGETITTTTEGYATTEETEITPEITSTSREYTEVTELTSATPEVTHTIPIEVEKTTATPEVVYETTTTEYITTPFEIPTANESIPNLIEEQFEHAGYPVDVKDLKPNLPETYLYAACLPYSTYLTGLPSTLLNDIVMNSTAFTKVMLDHICRAENYKPDQKSELTCTSLGGTPIVISYKNGQRYCNNIPIIGEGIPTTDGIVYFINGFFVIEPELITTLPTELPTEISPTSIASTSTIATEITTEAFTPTGTEKYTTAPEISSVQPEVTTEVPHLTETTPVEYTTKTVLPTEYTTETPVTTAPNETIPSIIEQQFEKAGHPIDIESLKPNLPDTYLYIACVPYSTYLSGLPTTFLQDFTHNNTAVTNALLNHICRDTIHSSQLKQGYTCTTLGGVPLVLSYQNGQYFCNKFPIIGAEVPTVDGIVYFIKGLLFFEHEGFTPPQIEVTTLYPEVSTTTLSPEASPTTLSPEASPTTLSPEASPTTPSAEVSTTALIPEVTTGEVTEVTGATEYTSIRTVTREPKFLNVTESSVIYPSTTEEITSTQVGEVSTVAISSTETSAPTERITQYSEATTESIPAETPEYATTSYPEITSKVPETTETTTVYEATTVSILPVAPNDTIPSVVQQQFEQAGYPIDVTDLESHLPETSLYTACVPYSSYLTKIPSILQDLIKNNTAVTNGMLDNICQGAVYSPQLKNGYTCTSLGGKPIILRFYNNQYYCNNFPVIKVDVPTKDGVIYFINGFLPLEHEGITSTPLEITTFAETPTTGITSEITTSIPTISESTEYTTLKTVTSEVELLNITESPTVYTTTEKEISTEYPGISTVVPPVTEITSEFPEATTEAVATEKTVYTATEEVTTTVYPGETTKVSIEYPEVTSKLPELVTTEYTATEGVTTTVYPGETTKVSTEYPEVTSKPPELVTSEYTATEGATTTVYPGETTKVSTEYPEVTSKLPELVTTEYTTIEGVTTTVYPGETTEVSTEYPEITSTLPESVTTLKARTTTPIPPVPTNDTIPSVIKQQFEISGYPIDVTDVQKNLPATSLYTACVPYSEYLLSLPSLFLQDLTKNNTGVTNALLNHICPGAVYSPQLKNGYTCTSLGGKPIIFTFYNNRYFCNNFPVIKVDVPTRDGVVHFITGFLFFEEQGITPPAPELSTEYTELTTPTTSLPITEISPETTSRTEVTETEEPLTTPEVTEYTTLKTVTREPKLLNITEFTTPYPVTTQYPEITTEAVLPPEVTSVTEETTTTYPEITSEGIPEVTTTKYPEITSEGIPEVTSTKYPEITSEGIPEVTTTKYPEITSEGIPEETTTKYPTITSEGIPEVTTTKYPEITSEGTPEVTTTKYPEITSEGVPEETTEYTTTKPIVTEYPSTAPVITSTKYATEYPEITTEVSITTENITAPSEYTTEIPTISPNDSIPSVIKDQFEKAGYPIDVTGLQQHLPDTHLYTACVPYSTYLSELPKLLLQDLSTNKTATTDTLLDHICQGATFSPQLKNGYTCTSLGGKPIIFVFRNNQFYCNNIVVIKVDVPTSDGVVHFIKDLISPEPAIVTPTTEETPVYPEVSTTPSPLIPSVTTPALETTSSIVPETSPYEITESTTLSTATREPKELNVTEETGRTETAVTTEIVSTLKYPATTEIQPEATTLAEGITLTTKAFEEFPSTSETSVPTVEVTGESTESPKYTTVSEVVTETTSLPEYTTPAEVLVPTNETIPTIFEQEFEKAGYPIDITGIKQELPDSDVYTACIPYHQYLIELPQFLLRDLTINQTAITNVLLNHICRGTTFSKDFNNGYTCTSLGNTPIIFVTRNGQHYCNNLLIIKPDIPTADGVVHVTNGLFLPELLVTSTTETTSEIPETVSTVTSIGTTSPQLTTEYPEYTTTLSSIPEETTPQVTATREPKFLNITEATEVTEYTTTVEEGLVTSTPKTEEITTSIYPEVTSISYVPISTTGIPEEITANVTEFPEATSPSTTPFGYTPTITAEITTEEISTAAPNKTIPQILQEEFQKADHPIDVSELIPRLPDRYLYTAFLPYYYYIIHGLPAELVEDLARNKTAVGDLFVNHICPEVTYSNQFQSGYSCISLGGPPILVTFENGRYFVNGFPIIVQDITTTDGVVHLIDGLFVEGGTPPPELAPGTPVTTIATTYAPATTLVTEIEGYTTESITPVPTEFTSVATREPKVLNISEPTEVYTEATSVSPGITEEVTPSKEYAITTEESTETTSVISGITEEVTPSKEYGVTTEESTEATSVSPGIAEVTTPKEYAVTTEVPEVPTSEEYNVTEVITTSKYGAIVTTLPTTTYETSSTELATEYQPSTEESTASVAPIEISTEAITTPAEVTKTPVEYTTVESTSPAPNVSILSILEDQFKNSGNPIDVSDLKPLLPENQLYTAFLPNDYYIMHGLPKELVQDLTRNKTAVSVIFANQICPQARYSKDFHDGFSCTSIGGLPIVITVTNGKYYANGFPIITQDIQTTDGVVHLIEGLFVEGVTPPTEVATTTAPIQPYTEIPVSTVAVAAPEVTTAVPIVTEVVTSEIVHVTSPAITTESTTVEEGYTTIINATIPGAAQVTEEEATTEYTTLATATREPKYINTSEEITESTEPTEYSTAPVFTEASTEAVKETTEYIATTEGELTTEHVTREPKLLNETVTPEYATTEISTQPPEVTQETTVKPVEYTTIVTANITEVSEITTTSRYPQEVNETLPTTAYAAEVTTEVGTTEYAVTEEVQVTTVPPEYATTRYPALYNASTEETTTLLYPEFNVTTTLPFYPPESRGILSVSIFFYLVDLSGVDSTLSQGGPYTILAPVDSAFHSLPPNVMTQLKMDMPFLRELLLYHIIPQKIVSTELENDNLLTSLQGQDIRCNVYGPVITLGGAKIVMPDGSSGYGVLHIVNRVLYPVPVGTVLETIQPRNDTDKVQALLQNTTLPSRLKGPGPFTIFLPSDRAINSLPSYVMDILENNATLLEEFVLNHMVNGTYYTAGMSEGLELTSLGGQILRISQAGGLTVNGVPIVNPDISVTNGVVHIIDQILFDPSQDIYIPKTHPEIRKDLNVFELTKQLNLTTFANLLVDSGLSVNLSSPGYYTVFAPTNDAFAAMPPSQLDTIKADPLRLVQILLYHILPVQIETNQMTNEMVIPSLLPTKSVRMNIYVNNRGPWYTASGSQILMPNNEASNGVVHVVHQVLYIPLGDIVQTVEKCSILQTLRHIISISGLEDQLRGGNYTLLAPNDAAFNKLPEDTLERLTLDPHLSRLFLLGHLIRGTVNTEGIFDESTLTTASNNQLYVRALKDCILLNSAAIQYPDVTADNGVVHVIDRVL